MITDVERQFFETFNIEKRQVDCEQPVRIYCPKSGCKSCKYSVYEYPEITDRHYLLILARYGNISHYETMTELTLEEIKELILKDFLTAVDNVDCITRYQVEQYIKTLFKEG